MLHRTQRPTQWDDGKLNRGGIRIDIPLATTTERAPVFAELKLPGDMDPSLVLVQALARAAHLATPAQYGGLRKQPSNGKFPESDGHPRLDVYMLFVGTTLCSSESAAIPLDRMQSSSETSNASRQQHYAPPCQWTT